MLLLLGIALLGPSLNNIERTTGSSSGFSTFAFGSVHVQAVGFLGSLWDSK